MLHAEKRSSGGSVGKPRQHGNRRADRAGVGSSSSGDEAALNPHQSTTNNRHHGGADLENAQPRRLANVFAFQSFKLRRAEEIQAFGHVQRLSVQPFKVLFQRVRRERCCICIGVCFEIPVL